MGIRVKIMNAHDPVRICGDLLNGVGSGGQFEHHAG